MRATFTALLLAFAVFFTAGAALAESPSECVVNWAPRGSFAVQADLERAAQTATRLGAVYWREVPGQSRAPIACADPNDPRCHFEQSDAPAQGRGFGVIGGDGVMVPDFAFDLPEPHAVDLDHADFEGGGPRDGHAVDLLRPPGR
jgi:hypothetical protein